MFDGLLPSQYKIDPRVSFSELVGEAKQLRRSLHSSAWSVIANAGKLLAVNSACIAISLLHVNSAHVGNIDLVRLIMPYIASGYSLKLLFSIGWTSFRVKPVAAMYEDMISIIEQRRPPNLLMDDIH